MAGAGFNDLALQYVLADEKGQERVIAERAATAIETSTNGRVAVGQWVASINRWIQPADDANDDIIARAKALGFLASTLEVLQSKNVALRAEQIKLLVSFFDSLFSSDHRAGVTASAKALRYLTRMNTFHPSLGNDIIQNVCKLGDDFKLQTPATRLELYELFLGLLRNPSVVSDLGHQHGSACGFMVGLLGFCRNERDPLNLIKWFQTLEIFLQNFDASPEVTSEVFKTFSAYFPISLRASATSSGVTADDLKSAVRSCFSAHQRLASLAIPFLLSKLDQGDAVTVAVKVDILQTLDACLTRYENPKQSVVPYVDQIWSSLKYEVRNGEIPDAVKATLKVIGSIAQRLDTEELRSFSNNAWKDLAEDLSNPTYTAQAGRLLVSIAGATVQSFMTIIPRAFPHIQSTIKHAKSSSHKQDLLTLLNSILLIRSHLVDETLGSGKGLHGLEDGLFGDSLFLEVYLPLWQDNPANSSSVEYASVLGKVMEGVATLVGQKSTTADPPRRLCSDSICEQIFRWLAEPAISCPLEDRKFTDSITDEDTNQTLRDSAVTALRKAVPLYPAAFQQLLLQYLSSVQTAYQLQPVSGRLISEIRLVAATLCEICYSELLSAKSQLSYSILLINMLMEGLLWMLLQQALPRYWTAFICSVHLAIHEAITKIPAGITKHELSRTRYLTHDWCMEFTQHTKSVESAELDPNQSGYLKSMIQTIEGSEVEEADVARHTLAYSLWVVRHLYSRFAVAQPSGDTYQRGKFAMKLGKDFHTEDHNSIVQQDICLHQVASLATTVVRALSVDEQNELQLGQEVFSLFQPVAPSYEISPLDDFRTAPLSMGILQGLHPKAIDSEGHIMTLENLCYLLTSHSSPPSDTTRAALDAILAVLSNRLDVKSPAVLAKRTEIEQNLLARFTSLTDRVERSGIDSPVTLRVFRSILHYLAGDVSRFLSQPRSNMLLNTLYQNAPFDIMMGRQLAQNFDVLVSPKECLEADNHAIRKKLSGEWLYYQVVSPRLTECFPNTPNSVIDERRAVNRAVGTFAILKHLRYDHYASDVERIVRVAIRSLSTFRIGVEMESCLTVLLEISKGDPEKLKEHLSSLISSLISVYDMARRVARTADFMEDAGAFKARGRETTQCRKFVLEFFHKLPTLYDTQYLWPHRHLLLRPLWQACGDPVREIRRLALATRQTWDNLA